jgi:hypothetical protein
MLKLINSIDQFIRIISENLERKVSRTSFIKASVSAIFVSMMTFTAKPALAGSSSWCEAWDDMNADCNYPNRTRCPGCSSKSASAKCPTGYKVTYAYYPQTGCWCNSMDSWGTQACCDCTSNSNNDVYNVHHSDCGCNTIW